MGNERLGILLRIASTLAFALMGVCIKAVGTKVPLGEIVFFRSAVALIPLVAFLWWQGAWPQGLKTNRPLGHFWRCLAGVGAMFTAFATIRILPLAEANMLSYLAPVILAILAWLVLGEKLTKRRIAAVTLGLSGAAVFCVPAFVGVLPSSTVFGIVFGMASAILTAIALIFVRRLTNAGERAGTVAFWFAIACTIAGLITWPFGWVWPDFDILVLLIGAGLLGGVAQILMTMSFGHADAAALAPFEYLSIFWAVSLGFLVFAEIPTWSFVFAVPLILSGAIVARPKRGSCSKAR